VRSITSIELHREMREIRPLIEGSWLRKFYELGDGLFRISFYKSNTKTTLFIDLSCTINATSYQEPSPQASGFAMGVRKRLKNAKVTTATQLSSDRIAEFRLTTHAGERMLIIELFGKGNLIIVNPSTGKIELCYRNFVSGSYIIKPGAEYKPPKPMPDIFSAGENGVKEILSSVEAAESASTIQAVSRSITIGPLYIEEALARCGINPQDPFKKNMAGIISKSLYSIFKEAESARPRIYLSNEGKVRDYAVCKLSKYSSLQEKQTESLNDILEELSIAERKARADAEPKKLAVAKETSMEAQRKHMEGSNAEAQRCREAASKIYENLQQINYMFSMIREKRGITAEELNKSVSGIKIIRIDYSKSIVEIEVA
jgi:predicted ribosome quality control (RQC) complex YloA/Tae2 family protein